MEETIQIESQTYVLTSSSRVDNRTRVLKKNDTFAVFDWNGVVSKVGHSALGLFSQGTRHLSQWEVTIGDKRPLPLNSTMRDDNDVLLVDQTTPDILINDKPGLAKGTLHLRRELVVLDSKMRETLTLTNYSGHRLCFDLAYFFDADYRDIFEIRGIARPQRGDMAPIHVHENSVELSYMGRDEVQRQTLIDFDRTPSRMTGNMANFDVEIGAGQQYTLSSNIECINGQAYVGYNPKKNAGDQGESSQRRLPWASITTDNDQFNEWLERSMSDLCMLVTETRYGPYPYAGVPWFATPFGRDGLFTALQTLWVQPELSKGVLRFLAKTQATEFDQANEAQPGKIVHELREGEMAALGEIPFRRYYGTVDATPLFIVLAGRYFLRTNDEDFIRSLWPNIQAALQWIELYGDMDGDGFVEYARSTDKGLLQQGWKDSWDSIFHESGHNAEAPIALCEVQAYVYEAYEQSAMLARVLGHDELRDQLAKKAADLKDQFDAHFWDDELGTYVLALDKDKKPCRVKSSNAAHALFCGIAKPHRAEQLSRSLTSSEAFNGWGLRTIYHGQVRYNPMSYHNGSVWPHDTAVAAAGLSYYGFNDDAMLFLTGLYEASNFWELSRLPELFCGFTRLQGQAPTNYPVACIPQAWASGCVFMLLQSVLGLVFTEEKPILFRKPKLPPYINRLKIANLSYGAGSIDLVLRRRGSDVAIHAENREGAIEVCVVI